MGVVGRHFCSFIQGFARIFMDFVKVLREFFRDFVGFARIFNKFKHLGMRLHPLHPASYTSF